MAMSKGISSSQVREITECVICTEPFKEPKILPCIHTFCLHCLEKHGEEEEKDPGDKVKCPLCRKEFTIPPGGFKELPNNDFINQLMQLNKTSMKMAPSYCEKHSAKEIEFYCYYCKMIACYVCCVELHNAHRCSDVKKAGEELRGMLLKNIEKISPCIVKTQVRRKRIKETNKSLIDKVTTAKREIEKRYDQLKFLLDSYRDKLLSDLDSFKVKTLKELETKEEEAERRSEILESYKQYCEELKDKGTACEISRFANDLQATGDQLKNEEEQLENVLLSSVDIVFRPLPTITHDGNNWIGELQVQGNDQSPLQDKRADFRSTSFLNQSSSSFQVLSGKGWIWGVAVIRSQLFVGRGVSSDVEVYDTNNLVATNRLLKICDEQLSMPKLAGCSYFNCLYLSSNSSHNESVTFRFDLSNSLVSKWPVKGWCGGLSATNNGNILVTLYTLGRIQEYTTDGSLIREIILDSSIDCPLHSVQLSDGNFAVSHSGSTHDRVCIVDSGGRILKSYGEAKGSGVGQLNSPCYLSAHDSGSVFVADNGNRRIELLSPALTLLGTVQTPGHELSCPLTVYLDKINHRLYISEESGCVLVLNDTDGDNVSDSNK